MTSSQSCFLLQRTKIKQHKKVKLTTDPPLTRAEPLKYLIWNNESNSPRPQRDETLERRSDSRHKRFVTESQLKRQPAALASVRLVRRLTLSSELSDFWGWMKVGREQDQDTWRRLLSHRSPRSWFLFWLSEEDKAGYDRLEVIQDRQEHADPRQRGFWFGHPF